MSRILPSTLMLGDEEIEAMGLKTSSKIAYLSFICL